MTIRKPVPSPFAKKYLAKMATAQMTSTIEVLRPASPDFNVTTGEISASTASTVWSGPARIYAERGSLTTIGEEVVSLGSTYIAIPQTATLPFVDDIAHVLSTQDDINLIGQYFRIVDVSLGGVLSPTRTLTVTLIENSPWMS